MLTIEERERDPIACPEIMKEAFRDGVSWARSCRVISDGAGFTCSVTRAFCRKCVKQGPALNPLTRRMIRKDVLNRVSCGDATHFYHSKTMTADEALLKGERLGASTDDMIAVLTNAVGLEHLGHVRAVALAGKTHPSRRREMVGGVARHVVRLGGNPDAVADEAEKYDGV